MNKMLCLTGLLLLIAGSALPQVGIGQAPSKGHTTGKTPTGAHATAPTTADIEQARKAIEGIYAMQSGAITRKDVPAFLDLCTPDYKDIKMGRQSRPAAFIRQSLPATLLRYETIKMTSTLKSLTLKGDKATTTAVRHVEVLIFPQYAKTDRFHCNETVTEDVWVKTERGWRTQSSKELSFKRLDASPQKK